MGSRTACKDRGNKILMEFQVRHPCQSHPGGVIDKCDAHSLPSICHFEEGSDEKS